MPDRIEQLTKILAAEPGDVFCMYGLALEHGKRGDAATAVSWFDRTLAVDPNYCYAYFHKARVQRESGDAAGAMSTLQVGLKKSRACGDLKAASEIEAFLDELTE